MVVWTEADVEHTDLDYLSALGWQVSHRPNIAPDTPAAERTAPITGWWPLPPTSVVAQRLVMMTNASLEIASYVPNVGRAKHPDEARILVPRSIR